MELDSLIEKVSNLDSSITRLIQEAVKENEVWICKLNTEDQLYEKGINSDGVALSSYQPYTTTTTLIKRSKGQPYNRVTLRDEGDFHRSFFIIFMEDGFFIDSDDPKMQALAEKYSSDSAKFNIFGLTDYNVETVAWDIVYPELIENIRSLLL